MKLMRRVDTIRASIGNDGLKGRNIYEKKRMKADH